MKTTFKMKQVFERLHRTLLCVAVCFASIAAVATPTISDVKLTPIEPIGVAIDYTVSGATEADSVKVFDVSMSANGTNYVALTLSGATNCVNGAHRVYWNMAKDGLKVDPTTASLTVAYNYPRYCVINLAGGSSASSYPVVYMNAEPKGGFTNDTYKTTKLVLKRVDAGSFTMGNSSESDNKAHSVTLSKTFYMGLFEVTQKQWYQVMGSNPCSSTSYGKGDAYPVHYVSYNDIRGSSSGAKWPTSNAVDSSSFLGKLRTKTGLAFDLPTEAQWEYTCRAGTTTTYSYGSSANGDYMWYTDNSSSKTHEVGTRKANSWGFYDMHGNVWEWCLDWYSSSTPSGGTDPKGSSSGSYRVLRGGGWSNNASYCASAYRRNLYPSSSNDYYGFRLSRTLP